jgi:hypothetical protein
MLKEVYQIVMQSDECAIPRQLPRNLIDGYEIVIRSMGWLTVWNYFSLFALPTFCLE